MKFCALILELHLPQNFCHIHTDIQTDGETNRQTFSRNCQIVIRTSQNVYIYQKLEAENLDETNTFSIYTKKSKNVLFFFFFFSSAAIISVQNLQIAR